MRRLVFAILVSFLLVSVAFVHSGNISAAQAASSIHQGDLVLTGNNVTTIEGRFDINGSIIVEENATLVLRNAILNFTQVTDYQFNMTLQNPADGNPRLLMENATITTNNHYQEIYFDGNSSASINNLTVTYTLIFARNSSVVSISDSTMHIIDAANFSVVNLSDSYLFLLSTQDDSSFNISSCTLGCLEASERSSVNVSNSTIKEAYINSRSANCSVTGLEAGFASYWNFQLNCSATVAQSGWAPNFTLTDTQVDGWTFDLEGFSNATISNCELSSIYVYDLTLVSVYDSSFSSGVGSSNNSTVRIYNSTTQWLYSDYGSPRVWLVNSTSDYCYVYDQSEVYVCWYLGVHVIDSIGQDVPYANVTATYPNATIAESKLTNAKGWAKLTLMEKMMNATGSSLIGNYTITAEYELLEEQQFVNMTENKQITIQLPFIIPEFPSFIVLPLFMIATLLAVIVCRRKHSM